MNVENINKLKEVLGTKEANQLIGEFCRAYEFLRFNGTRSQVEAIYETNEPNYINEKTRKYFDSGSGFAANLAYGRLAKLGEVLIGAVESGDLISLVVMERLDK